MPSGNLTDEERAILRRVLVAAVDGPYFPDGEFQTSFGLPRAKVRAISAGVLDDARDGVRLAINTSFGNLLGYPHGEESRLEEDVGATIVRLSEIFRKWKAEGTA